MAKSASPARSARLRGVCRSLSANDRLAPAATNMQLMARCLAKEALCNAVWPVARQTLALTLLVLLIVTLLFSKVLAVNFKFPRQSLPVCPTGLSLVSARRK